MRKLLVVLFGTLTFSLSSQSIEGAWEAVGEIDGQKLRSVAIFAGGFHALSAYDFETGAFIFSNGGKYQLEGNIMTKTVEFNTNDSNNIGKEHRLEINLSDDEFSIVGDNMIFKRLDNGSPGDLAGAWLISGRMRDGEIQERDINRPRKTMKILSGTRFQWIAYNTKTKEFRGTGGGIYTTSDGKYTEKILFFSRDNARVGASLEFNYEVKDGAWHHSGKSSKGNPMYEIWVRRK